MSDFLRSSGIRRGLELAVQGASRDSVRFLLQPNSEPARIDAVRDTTASWRIFPFGDSDLDDEKISCLENTNFRREHESVRTCTARESYERIML